MIGGTEALTCWQLADKRDPCVLLRRWIIMFEVIGESVQGLEKFMKGFAH